MDRDSLLTGILAVLDPTTRVVPARSCPTTAPPRSFTEGAEALIAELDRLPPPDTAEPADHLPGLRLAAVRVSFISALITVACLPALALDIEWPLIFVAAASLAATLLIVLFLAGLYRSIARREALEQLHHQHMKDLLASMARQRVADLEDRELIERSKNNPELTSAILATIMTEYTDAELPAAMPRERSSASRTLSLSRVLAVAGPHHPLARVLRRLASDVKMTDTSEAL
ncbi:hypothetical protein [Streptomyces geranii]|uniref:hypothetical protein n=1 Tax=Streptomyces geranii TaxID=2058923 RepID=UPI001300B137|nr:hypothetical protein [Streptomyces geranii]